MDPEKTWRRQQFVQQFKRQLGSDREVNHQADAPVLVLDAQVEVAARRDENSNQFIARLRVGWLRIDGVDK